MKKCLKCNGTNVDEDFKCHDCANCVKHDKYYLFDPENSKSNEFFHDSQIFLYSKYEDTNFWLVCRRKLILKLIGRYLKSNMNNYMEIGIGSGYILDGVQKKFKCAKVLGADIYTSILDLSEKYINKDNLIQMNALNIPFQNEFDGIGIFDVLEHIKDDKKVLFEIHNALNDDGLLFLIVPQHKFLWSSADDYTGHVRRYLRTELLEKLDEAGFLPVFKSSFMALLLPLMLVSRFLKKFNKKNNDIKDEIELNPILNFIFKQILRFECVLIKLGVDFPFGGSLVVVAKKK